MNDLGNFYELNKKAGIRPNSENNAQFDYLDTPEVFDKVVDFSDGNTTLVTFKIPVIHCSSCIWLLESLHTLEPNIPYSQVHFTRKPLLISFNAHDFPLINVGTFLTTLDSNPHDTR